MAQHAHTQEGALAHETLANTKAHVTATQEPGTMDITRQQQTFVTFVRFVTRMVILIAAILIFMALVNG
jgi:hypothetical protein